MVLCYAQARQDGPVNVPVNGNLLTFNGSQTENSLLINPVDTAGEIHLAPGGVYVVSYRLTGTEDGLVAPRTTEVRTELRINGVRVDGSEAYQNIQAGFVSASAVSGNVIITTGSAADYVLTLRNISGTTGATPPIPVTTISDFSITILKIR